MFLGYSTHHFHSMDELPPYLSLSEDQIAARAKLPADLVKQWNGIKVKDPLFERFVTRMTLFFRFSPFFILVVSPCLQRSI